MKTDETLFIGILIGGLLGIAIAMIGGYFSPLKGLNELNLNIAILIVALLGCFTVIIPPKNHIHQSNKEW